MSQIHKLSLQVALASCLLLTGCKEAVKLQADWKQTSGRLNELQTRIADLDNKLISLRKTMPVGTSPQESARQLAERCAADIKLLDTELLKTTIHLRESESTLAKLKRDLSNGGS